MITSYIYSIMILILPPLYLYHCHFCLATGPQPQVGEHTRQVLLEAGYSTEVKVVRVMFSAVHRCVLLLGPIHINQN